MHDLSWSPEGSDRIDYEMSRYHFLGDAYPWFNMDCFGPGVLAAMMGAELDNSTGRVWFWPPDDLPILEIYLQFDTDSIWLNRILDICAAAMERWQGQVLVGMTDLGGNLDVPATFRTTEKLLFDLIDYPEEVERLAWELTRPGTRPTQPSTPCSSRSIPAIPIGRASIAIRPHTSYNRTSRT